MSEQSEVAVVPVVDGERPTPPGAEQQPAVASCEDGDATATERNEKGSAVTDFASQPTLGPGCPSPTYSDSPTVGEVLVTELDRLRRALVWIDRLHEPVGPDTLDALGLVIPDDGWGIEIPDGVTAEQFIHGGGE